MLYEEFEELQAGSDSTLAGGDQKTGVIGEYYAKCYIEKGLKFKVSYAKTGESYDLSYTDKVSGKTIMVQVKCVSSHSKTRTIAPLSLTDKEGTPLFDLLYLISLDSDFQPEGFYINTYDKVLEKFTQPKSADPKRNDPKDKVIRGSIMKGKTKDHKVKNGSRWYDFDVNLAKDMREALDTKESGQ